MTEAQAAEAILLLRAIAFATLGSMVAIGYHVFRNK